MWHGEDAPRAKDSPLCVPAPSAKYPGGSFTPISRMQVGTQFLVLFFRHPERNAHQTVPTAAARKWST